MLAPKDEKSAWQMISDHCAFHHPDWPMQRLSQLGLGPLHAHVLISLAMVEEDATLALLFEPEAGQLTLGGLTARWRGATGIDAPELVRVALQDLVECGLVTSLGTGCSRNDRGFAIADPVADLLLGLVPRGAGMDFVDAAMLADARLWVAPAKDSPCPDIASEYLATEKAGIILIRGAAHNGRKTFAQMAAHMAGRNLLCISQDSLTTPENLRIALALAVLSNAALLCEIDSSPGETVRLPLPHFTNVVPLMLICNERTSVEPNRPITLRSIRLPMPDQVARLSHWKQGGFGGKQAARHAEDWILTSGNIRRASACTPIAEDKTRDGTAIRLAMRDLRDARLDALASPVDLDREPTKLFLDREGDEEIQSLILRCKHRERLARAQGSAGVRALLSGASGTGKTLAARHVAWQLGKDLYRIDLSATVNKYIGETEKALERALSAAEELDIVLLLDEGDALMARRTDVGTSNDRYANLETNFLLQRIESFGGILLVTSNDAERIDQAFSRRMDASIILRPPDQVRREAILHSHLGDDAEVSDALIRDIACRCALTGGQIRNVALHAQLLALDSTSLLSDSALRQAIEREYRKTGTPCPLRSERTLAAVR
ncbi:MAG: ATP-binding protein [Sphingomonadales bacterium]|nr:ATP-binding protein [Sphingomonadales bacterium]